MKTQAQKVGAGEAARWPDGLVMCGECIHAQGVKPGVSRELITCDIFSVVQIAAAGHYCTAFRPVGWGDE